MNDNLDPTNENFSPEEIEVEKKLRPLTFDDFTGQEQVLDNLQIFVQAANQRDEALDTAEDNGKKWFATIDKVYGVTDRYENGSIFSSTLFKSVFRIRIRLDPFHYGQPDSDPGSKNQPKSWKISTKINKKSLEYHTFFFQNY